MTTTLNASTAGAGGFIATGDNSGSLALQTAGTTAVTIDTSQNVGIGTTSPTDTGGYGRALDLVGGSNGCAFYMRGSTNPSTVYASIQYDNNSNRTNIAAIGTGNFLRFVTVNAEVGRFDTSGNLLVGTTSANGTEKFNVTSSSTEVAFFSNSSNTSAYSGIRSNIGSGGNNTSTWHFRGETRGVANWYLYGNGTTSYSSDIRLKKNIQTARGYLEDLNKLRVVKYQWKGENPDCQQVELGLIAQEVEEVFPNLIQVHEMEGFDDIKHIKQSVLPFMLLKAIQELKAINDQQAETINALTARVAALEAK